MWHKLVAADLIPLFGCFYARSSQHVDAQTDRGAPGHCIFHKLHLPSIEGEEVRAGALDSLLRHNLRVGLHVELSAHRPIGPENAHHVRARMVTQAEMNEWSRNGLLLRQQAGTYLHFAANAKRVDALVTSGLPGPRTDYLPVIVFGAAVVRQHGLPVGGNAYKVEASTTREVCGIENQCGTRRFVERSEEHTSELQSQSNLVC